MKILRNPIPKLVFLIMAIAVVGSLSQKASAQEAHRWELKGGIVLADFDDPLVIGLQGDDRIFMPGGDGGGTQIALEYRASDLLGYELSLASIVLPDVERDVADGTEQLEDNPHYVPIVAGINLHLMSARNFDVYVGPRVAYVILDDIDVTLDGEVETFDIGNEYGWGIATGFSYRFGDRWSFTADATYIDVDFDVTRQGTDDSVDLGLDPLTFVFGASYRF